MNLSHWMEPKTGAGPILVCRLDAASDEAEVGHRLRAIAEAGFGGAALTEGIPQRETGLPLHCVIENWNEAARRLLQEDPAAVAKRLCIERCLNPKDAAEQAKRPDVLGVYCLSLAEGPAVNGLEVFSSENPPPDDASDLLVAVSVREGAAASSDAQRTEAPGGCAADLLSRDVSRRLIEIAFEPFASLLSAPVLPVPVLPALVPDSPTVAFVRCPDPPHSGAGVPACVPGRVAGAPQEQAEACTTNAGGGSLVWNSEIPRLYAERWREDPIPLLPLLWFDGPGAARFRWRVRSLVADMFRANFLEPLSEYLAERACLFAGEFGHNGALSEQIVEGWGPVMRFFETMALPVVCDSPEGAPAPLLALKQAVSIAVQLRRTGVACRVRPSARATEILGDLVSRAGKACALGATRIVLDGAPASLAGDAKRLSAQSGEPAASAIVEGQPWWPFLRPLNDSLNRHADLLGQGRRAASLLVLSPSESIMAAARNPLPPALAAVPGRARRTEEPAVEIEGQFANLLGALQAQTIDFDIGDEDALGRRGRADLNTFRVGEGGEYTTVVVPPAVSWRAETLRMIRRFARRGGAVILARPIAPMVDFEPSSALEDLAEEFQNVFVVERAGREVGFLYNRLEPRAMQIRPLGDASAECLAIHHRRTGSHQIFLVANTSPDRDVEARVAIRAPGAIRILDAWTPRILLRDADEEKGAQAFNYCFRAGSVALFGVGGEADLTEPPHQRLPHATSSVSLADSWKFERADPNLAPLEAGRAAIDDDRSSSTQPIGQLRETLNRRLGSATQPCRVALSFAFDSRIEFAGSTNRALDAVIEPVEGMEVWVNGARTESEKEEWAIDRRFRRFDVALLVRRGKNVLEIRYPWVSGAAPVEAPILAGDFAATTSAGRVTLSEEPETLRTGPLADQGYPFYAGRMRLRQEFDLEPEAEHKRYFVNLRQPGAAVVRVRVGEHEPQTLLSAPYRVEIGRLLRGARHSLEIELVSTLEYVFPPGGAAARERLRPFGLLGGCDLETFDPDAQVAVPQVPVAQTPNPEEKEINAESAEDS